MKYSSSDTKLDRRSFAKLVALLFAGCSSPPKEMVSGSESEVLSATRHLGAQLYTVRNQLKDNAATVLKQIAEIGYKEVEVQDGVYPSVRQILSDLDLRITGYRLATPNVTGNWELWREFMKRIPGMGIDLEEQSLESAIEPASRANAKHVVISYLLPNERDTVDKLKTTIERMNACGEICKKSGLTLCYHNHASEFGPLEGTTAFDVLNQELDPSAVSWQIDVFWASVGGRNPAEVISSLGSGIASLHLKDKAAETPQQFQEMVPPESFMSPGQGVLDFPGILRAAFDAGINHMYVELDQTPGDPIDSLRESFEYLQPLLS